MDLKKLNILTLTGPNWGSYTIRIQPTAQILDVYDVIREEPKGTTPQTYNLLGKPTLQSHQDNDKCIAATAI